MCVKQWACIPGWLACSDGSQADDVQLPRNGCHVPSVVKMFPQEKTLELNCILYDMMPVIYYDKKENDQYNNQYFWNFELNMWTSRILWWLMIFRTFKNSSITHTLARGIRRARIIWSLGFHPNPMFFIPEPVVITWYQIVTPTGCNDRYFLTIKPNSACVISLAEVLTHTVLNCCEE